MSHQNANILRHVPSDECTRCGAQVDHDRGTFVLRDGIPVDEAEPVDSANLRADCFEDARAFLHGESQISVGPRSARERRSSG